MRPSTETSARDAETKTPLPRSVSTSLARSWVATQESAPGSLTQLSEDVRGGDALAEAGMASVTVHVRLTRIFRSAEGREPSLRSGMGLEQPSVLAHEPHRLARKIELEVLDAASLRVAVLLERNPSEVEGVAFLVAGPLHGGEERRDALRDAARFQSRRALRVDG